MRRIRAVWRSVVLLALAIFSLLMFVWVVANISLVLTAPSMIKRSRWFPNLARRLAGVPTENVYWPEPAELIPDEDGLYRVGDKLVEKPSWWHEFDRLLDWATDDPGSRRDMNWMFANFFVGGVLAGTGPGLIALGGWLAVTSWWPVAIGSVVTGFLVTPWLVRVHDKWTWFMLEPKTDGAAFRFWRRVRRRLKALWFVIGQFLLAVASFVVTTWLLVVGIPLHIWGLYSLAWGPLVNASRELTELRRRYLLEWAGVAVPSPYLPEPVVPKPRPDGMYRMGRQLYKTPRPLLREARYRWLMKDVATWRDFASGPVDLLFGLVLIPAALFVPEWALRTQARVSHWLLAPTGKAVLTQRVQQLTETRADATDTQAAELRRIERDLHDGAQARLVALGLHLGAVERLIDQDPEAAKDLVARTKAASAEALVELRDLVRGIHPPVLAERGLADAIRAVALDSPLDVAVHGVLIGKLAAPVESAAYFAVCELLVNVAKHANASHVTIHMRHDAGVLSVSVIDDGHGGAAPENGSGLSGIRRRLATFDGSLEVSSPTGGPTVATIRIPSG